MLDIVKYAEQGNQEKVFELIDSGVSMESYDKEENVSVLTMAISMGHIDLVEALIDKGAKVEIKSKKDDTLELLVYEDNVDMMHFLLKCGLNKGIKKEQMDEVLMSAVDQGFILMAETLIDIGGADINVKDKEGYGLLHKAILKKDKNMVIFLVKKGINYKTTVKNVPLPVALCVMTRQPELCNILRDPKSYIGYTKVIQN